MIQLLLFKVSNSIHQLLLSHHHVAPPAQISLTLSRHPSLSPIASSRFSRVPPVSAQVCCMLVLGGRPAFARPCERVNRRMSLMSSSLLFQLCLACLVRLTWIVFVMDGKWSYSCCFVGCCLLEMFSIARRVLVQLPLHTVKWFQVLLFIAFPRLNDLKYCYLKQIISLIFIIHFHTFKMIQVLLLKISNSIYQLLLSNLILIICLHTVI